MARNSTIGAADKNFTRLVVPLQKNRELSSPRVDEVFGSIKAGIL